MQGKSPSHRPVHHCTSDHEFSEEETELLKAVDAFKRKTGKIFLLNTDFISIFRSLGWAKVAATLADQ